MSLKSHEDVLDVAIIGAGVSGLYSGWRWLISEQGRGSRVAVFEMSDRVGGRLLSVAPPELPEARVELGGMRFISSQTAVSRLVKQLGLATTPFSVSEPGNVAYLRGKHLKTSDLAHADRVPYDIPVEDREGFTEGFTTLAAQRYLSKVLGQPHVDLKTVDWDKVARDGRYAGQSVRDIAMRYAYNREVAHESFQFAEDTSGYDSIFFTWNAADGFPWNIGDYGSSIEYFRLQDGYEALPRTLHQRFEDVGGTVHFHHRLVSFDEARLPDGSLGMRLRVARADTGSEGDGEAHEVWCRRLVLAMPRRSLELLEPAGPLLGREHDHVHRLIRSVEPIPLFKLALCYQERWWEPLGIQQGQSVTDLPIRQCYYWPVGQDQGPGVILIYNDGLDLDYWASLRSHPDRYQPPASLPNAEPSREWLEHPAPALMVEEAHRQLMLMHGLDPAEHALPCAAAWARKLARPGSIGARGSGVTVMGSPVLG